METILIKNISINKKGGNKNGMYVENLNLPFERKIEERNIVHYKNLEVYPEDNKKLKKLLTENFIDKKSIKLYKYRKNKVFRIYTDGGSFNNGKKDPDLPNFATFGTIIVRDDGEINYDEHFKTLDISIEENLNALPFKDDLNLISGSIENGTNNIGELYAAVRGIQYLLNEYPNEKLDIIVCSDSQYVTKGSTEWIHGWKEKGWNNNEGNTTKNLNLWKTMDEMLNLDGVNLKFIWQRGHSKNAKSIHEKFNYYCDKICNIEINRHLYKEFPELLLEHERKI